MPPCNWPFPALQPCRPDVLVGITQSLREEQVSQPSQMGMQCRSHLREHTQSVWRRKPAKYTNLTLWKKLNAMRCGKSWWWTERDPCKAGLWTSAAEQVWQPSLQEPRNKVLLRYTSWLPIYFLVLSKPCTITTTALAPCCSNRVKWGVQPGASKIQMPSDRQHAQEEPAYSNYLPCQSKTSQA